MSHEYDEYAWDDAYVMYGMRAPAFMVIKARVVGSWKRDTKGKKGFDCLCRNKRGQYRNSK